MRIFIKKRDSELSDSEDARLLLKKVLWDYHSLSLSLLTERKNKDGKPYFENCPIHFNISHSLDYVVLAVGECEVGIDIQRINNISEKVLKRFVGKKGENALENTLLWTHLESYAKLIGRGIPLRDDERGIPCEYFDFTSLDGYVISVCLYAPADIPEFILIKKKL